MPRLSPPPADLTLMGALVWFHFRLSLIPSLLGGNNVWSKFSFLLSLRAGRGQVLKKALALIFPYSAAARNKCDRPTVNLHSRQVFLAKETSSQFTSNSLGWPMKCTGKQGEALGKPLQAKRLVPNLTQPSLHSRQRRLFSNEILYFACLQHDCNEVSDSWFRTLNPYSHQTGIHLFL